ncbi:MAG: WYL domain-containing protein [Deinococcus sp.]|nr:WYL domain-containing protein [Deinococcus sp.]
MGDPLPTQLPPASDSWGDPDLSPRPANRQAKTWDKARRLTEIPRELASRHRTAAQLAEQFGVGIRSIQRDLYALEKMGYAITFKPHSSPRAYCIEERGRGLTAPEALAAFTALRLAYHQSPGQNRHVRDALDRIAEMLPPELRHTLNDSVVDNGAAQLGERDLEWVSQAWLERRVLRFDYQRPGGELERGNELCVYFIEISRTNLAPYVIGLEQKRRRAVRTFKLSRMLNLQVLDSSYEPDPGFDPRTFLSDAWGVIGGGQPITVRVRFTPDTAYRVLEGGYPNMRHQQLADGSVEAEFCAGADASGLPRELMPFLLGWGPRAEVLAPPHVREHWLAELREAVRRYGSDS